MQRQRLWVNLLLGTFLLGGCASTESLGALLARTGPAAGGPQQGAIPPGERKVDLADGIITVERVPRYPLSTNHA